MLILELWDLYDAQRQKTGRTIRRGEPLEPGQYHLVVDAVIINSRGEFLIQQRAHEKDIYPDVWTFTGGSALAGEDGLTAVLREVREELGFAPDESKTRLYHQMTERHNHRDIYLIEADIPAQQLHLQKEEVQDARWMLPEEFLLDPALRAQVSVEVWFEALIGGLSRLSGERRVKLGRYRHFRGKEYIVRGIAVHSETLCPMVIYQAQYGEFGLWTRPLSMWNERVTRGDIDAPRFTYIGPVQPGC